MFNTHLCKNCFVSYQGKPETCPNCGAELHPKKQEELDENGNKIKKEKVKKQRKPRLTSKQIMDSINFEDLVKNTNDKDVKSWRDKRKKEKPEFKVQENGEFNIDTKDVTYLPQTHNYSAKKARGEYTKPDIKWWEVYKWADVLLARRKVKKQVNRAGTYKPEAIKKSSMIALCIFFGWCGIHNFYARNYRKALFTLIGCILGCCVIFIENPFFASIRVSIGGGLMFVVLFMWITDLINLIINKYSYRLSKWKFIDCLNTDTRAKLGYKYIDKDEYKKPWIVRVINSIKESVAERKEKKLKKQQEQEAKIQDANADITAEQTEKNEQAENFEEKQAETKLEKPTKKQSKNKKAKIVVKKNKK